MPPLPADSIHARACKLKCEKILTRPVLIYQVNPTQLLNACLHDAHIPDSNVFDDFIKPFNCKAEVEP